MGRCKAASRQLLAAARLSLTLLVPGCASETVVPRAGEDYESCAAPAAAAALDEAHRLVAAGREREALPALRRALAGCPRLVRAHLLQIELAQRLGGPEAEAVHAFYRDLPDDGSPLRPYLRAELAPDDATRLAELDEALRRDSSFYFAHDARGSLMLRLGRLENAVTSFRAALQARPAHYDSRRKLALALRELGRFEEAEQHLALYVRARPSDRAALKEHVRLLLYELSRAVQAWPIVQQLVQQDPEDVDALMDLAGVSWALDDLPSALKWYHRVLDLDRTQARAVLNLGNIYFYSEAATREPARRADALRKARNAYLYYLKMDRRQGAYDQWDFYLAVPHRLAQIRSQLDEPAPADVTLDDF